MPDIRGMLAAMRYGEERWIMLGICRAVTIDSESVFLDIEVPEGDIVRARLVPAHAGAGWGIYHPVREGDQFLVLCPGGDPDDSPIAVGPLHSEEDPVPSEALSDSETWWLVARPGKSVRIKATGAGRIYLEAPTVEVLGEEHITGALSVDSNATVAGSVTGQGGLIGPSATVSGAVTSGSVSTGSISVGGTSIPLPGATGSFLSGDSPPKTVIVESGIVTSIL